MRSPKYFPQFVIGMSLLTCLICFDRHFGTSSLAQSSDAEAIRSLVGKLFESYQQKDLSKMLSVWSEKSPYLAENNKALQQEFATYERVVMKRFYIYQMQSTVDKARVRVAADLVLTEPNMEKPIEKAEKKTRTIHLVNEGGRWKVWRLIAREEDQAAAIIAAKTEEERNNLIGKDPTLITSDFVSSLVNLNYSSAVYGDYQRAITINQLAYKLAEQIGDQSVMAEALINAGCIYGITGTPEISHERALEYFRKSLKIGEAFGYKEIIAVSLIRAAIIYMNIGKHSQAAEYYRKCLRLFEELGDYEMTFAATTNLANIYLSNGNYANALELQLKCLKMSEGRLQSGADWARLSAASGNIGMTFFSQGNNEQALAYIQNGIGAAEKGIMLGDVFSKLYRVNLLVNMGYTYGAKGSYSLARNYFQKGLDIIEGFDSVAGGLKESRIYELTFLMGEVMAAENEIPQAIAKYQEVLRLAEKSRDGSRMALPSSRLSNIYLLQRDYREALSFGQQAVNAAEQVGQKYNLSSALVSTAKAYQKLGRPEEARQALTRAIDIAEQLREQFAGGELDRQRSFETVVTPYQTMIDFQIDQKRFTEAFSYTQQAKCRTLLELLQNGRVNIGKSISPAEREQEQQLSRKIGSLNRQITDEKMKSQPNKKRVAEVEEQLKKARLEFEAFQTALYVAHPELKVQRGQIQPRSFEDAIDLIPDFKTALLDFIVTDENVHLFVLTKDAPSQQTLNTYTISIERKSLTEKVERYRGRMANRDYDFQKLSHELYDLLIKPAQKQLKNKTNLIISPDGMLWELPFQTLLSPELHYLIEDAAISYAPSLSVLREMQLVREKQQAPAKASLLALGDPALGQRSKELVKFVKMDAELLPLPEAADQVRVLGRLYGPTFSKVYTGPAAKEDVVKEQSASYRILHLATHGILNDASPMYSHVMLSQTPGKSDEDGLLEAWEMMNLDLNADLVVLAACETGRGRARAGEGVIGMSWALFVAGCPRTVVSQWKVEASSTTALMVEFHKRFKTRYGGRQPAVSTAEAMRRAALKVMKNPEYAHPFYWGGFVVVGDGN